MSLIPVFNKSSSQAHTELELDVPSSWKACEICSSLFQKEKLKKSIFFTQAAQTAINQFLVSRNFRG
jgi:hypothetical protein